MGKLHQLEEGENIELEIVAREKWSSNRLSTQEGQKYRIWCDNNQFWTDSLIKTTPKGFFNILSYIVGQRVKGVKCFCLCGAYNQNENTGFAIGDLHEFDATTGELYFFANDTQWAYANNKGSIKINIIRLA